jgi:MSHA biogenesis protein MshM
LYYPHFGLKEPPFKITPNTDFFYSGANRGAVLDALVYAITNGEGIIKVVGEVGSGKTMLCRMLQTILPERIESIYLANPSVAPEDVLHAIAFELQLKLPKNADRLKVMQQLQAHLLSCHAEGRQVVIFVEEAQGMPLATLEEIRLLSNLETKQDKLLQIVLFGQPELDVNLNETHIRQLRERITHSFHLGPLQTKDIGEYLIFRLRAAGYHGPHLFSDAAIKKLSSSTEGLVRRVNILADKALLAAFADNLYQVTPKHVKAAINDSEFGAKPTNYKQYFLWAILLIGLLVASSIFFWWQAQHSRKNSHQATEDKVVRSTQTSPVKTSAVAVKSTETTSAAIIAKSPLVNNALIASANANVITPTTPTPVVAAANTVSDVAKVDSPVALPSKSAVVEPVVVKTIPKPAENPVEKPIDAKQQLLDKRLEASKNWLFNGQPETITLQIMSLTSDDQLKTQLDALSRQLQIDNVYLYRKNSNHGMYTVVLYGAFNQRSEALAALRELPSQIKNNRPHLRTLAGINRDIEQAQ